MTLVPSLSSNFAQREIPAVSLTAGVVTPSSFSCCLGNKQVNMCSLTNAHVVFPLEAQRVA